MLWCEGLESFPNSFRPPDEGQLLKTLRHARCASEKPWRVPPSFQHTTNLIQLMIGPLDVQALDKSPAALHVA